MMRLRGAVAALALMGPIAAGSPASAQNASASAAEYAANWGLAMIKADAANALGFTGRE